MVGRLRDLRALPKAHLHLHLEGAMRPPTLRQLSEQRGLEVPTIAGFGSFAAFEATYLAACAVLATMDDMRRLVTEVVEDAASAGAVWVEPASYLPHHRRRLGPDHAVLNVVLDTLASAASALGIGAGFIVAADRTVDPADSIDQARLAVEHGGLGVVGFGLANDETGHPPEPFAAAFEIARDGGLLATPHAGELAGPDSVAGALDALGADRIQHGVRAIEDPLLVERLASAGVCLDVCVSSNLLLSVFPSLEAHPLPALLDAGVRCSLNADDPLLFGPNLLEEYELCRSQLGFSDDRLAFIARCSIQASGAPQELKDRALAGIDQWLATPAAE
ncbi:MAG: adenosine deaminase [Actinomycetota bacterium]|nr:adenosine deaminase [Actinomycetota bacterium]